MLDFDYKMLMEFSITDKQEVICFQVLFTKVAHRAYSRNLGQRCILAKKGTYL